MGIFSGLFTGVLGLVPNYARLMLPGDVDGLTNSAVYTALSASLFLSLGFRIRMSYNRLGGHLVGQDASCRVVRRCQQHHCVLQIDGLRAR
jgi:hypothetical protein